MVENQKMNCEHVWREVSNYIDGDVDVALRSSMEEHFKTCQRCASVLAGTRNVVQLYGDERMLEVPAGFSRRLEKRLATNAHGEGKRLVELVGVAGAGGGDRLDCRRIEIGQHVYFPESHQVAPCAARQ